MSGQGFARMKQVIKPGSLRCPHPYGYASHCWQILGNRTLPRPHLRRVASDAAHRGDFNLRRGRTGLDQRRLTPEYVARSIQ